MLDHQRRCLKHDDQRFLILVGEVVDASLSSQTSREIRGTLLSTAGRDHRVPCQNLKKQDRIFPSLYYIALSPNLAPNFLPYAQIEESLDEVDSLK